MRWSLLRYSMFVCLFVCLFICLMVFSATFSNISVISWLSVLLVEETGVPGANHRPAPSHWQTVSHNVVSSTIHTRFVTRVARRVPLVEKELLTLPGLFEFIPNLLWVRVAWSLVFCVVFYRLLFVPFASCIKCFLCVFVHMYCINSHVHHRMNMLFNWRLDNSQGCYHIIIQLKRVWRYQRGNLNGWIEEGQTTQWGNPNGWIEEGQTTQWGNLNGWIEEGQTTQKGNPNGWIEEGQTTQGVIWMGESKD
jgi:8-oxo-dGTP pyrophosphatase MutT (NUDIX family)